MVYCTMGSTGRGARYLRPSLPAIVLFSALGEAAALPAGALPLAAEVRLSPRAMLFCPPLRASAPALSPILAGNKKVDSSLRCAPLRVVAGPKCHPGKNEGS